MKMITKILGKGGLRMPKKCTEQNNQNPLTDAQIRRLEEYGRERFGDNPEALAIAYMAGATLPKDIAEMCAILFDAAKCSEA